MYVLFEYDFWISYTPIRFFFVEHKSMTWPHEETTMMDFHEHYIREINKRFKCSLKNDKTGSGHKQKITHWFGKFIQIKISINLNLKFWNKNQMQNSELTKYWNSCTKKLKIPTTESNFKFLQSKCQVNSQN